MLALSRQSLTALTWASAALATPSNFVNPIQSRDLEVRQSTTAKCPDAYTSMNGLNFTTYCNQNNPFNDALPAFQVDSMQDCMEHCSRYWGNGEGCYGVVWTEAKGNCWLRNSTTSTDGLKRETGAYSALLKSGQMDGYDTACPNADLSSNNLTGVANIEYTTHCGKVISGFDACFSGYPGYPNSCLGPPYRGFFHAETLEECLRICIDQHPLCRAVSWNPGLEIGFANCWPKTGFSDSLDTPRGNMGTLHSATISQIDPIDRQCPAATTYTASGSQMSFDIHCGQVSTGTNFTTVHTQNVTACIDACAASQTKCVGAVFDSSLAGGFNNCYLQNTTNVISDQASATYAVLSGTQVPSDDPSSDSSGSPKAWIVGPVLGGIAALAAIGFAFFWFRKHKAKNNGMLEKDGHPPGHTGYGPAPAYSPTEQIGRQPYYDTAAAPMEMEATSTNELPVTTKYAHKPNGPAHELPS